MIKFRVYLIIKTIDLRKQNQIFVYLKDNELPYKDFEYLNNRTGDQVAAELLQELLGVKAKKKDEGYIPIKFESLDDDPNNCLENLRLISFFYSCTVPYFITPLIKLELCDIIELTSKKINYINILQQVISNV